MTLTNGEEELVRASRVSPLGEQRLLLMLLNCSVELTDVCNARCNYCIIGTGQPPHNNTRLGFLSASEFRLLFERFDEFLTDPVCTPSEDLDLCLRFCGIGEPTLHRDFLEFFRIGLRQPAVKQLAVVTNGSYLPPERTREMAELIRQHPNVIVELLLGLDGVDPEPQQRVKGIANILQINRDVEQFLRLKIQQQLRNLKFVFQIIVTDENCHHVKRFCDYWETILRANGLSYELIGDWSYQGRLETYDAFIWVKRRDADGPEQPHFDALHRAALATVGLSEPAAEATGVPADLLAHHQREQVAEATGVRVCGLFWYGINVNAAGDVSPCCIDNHFELKIGNLKDSSLRDIYRGETMRKLRLAHIRREFDHVPLCANCTSIHKYKYVSRHDIDTYLNGLAETVPPALPRT